MKSFPTAICRRYGLALPLDALSVPSVFPLLADLRGRAVLVIGGGAEAEHATAALLQAGALPLVGAPELNPQLRAWAQAGRLRWLAGRFEPTWLDLPDQPVWLTIAASTAPDLNDALRAAASARRLLTHDATPAASTPNLRGRRRPAPGSASFPRQRDPGRCRPRRPRPAHPACPACAAPGRCAALRSPGQPADPATGPARRPACGSRQGRPGPQHAPGTDPRTDARARAPGAAWCG